MHYTVCHILPVGSDMLKDYKEKYSTERESFLDMFSGLLEKFLSTFDSNYEFSPYNRYLDAAEIKRMSAHYGTADLQELAEKLGDWSGFPGGVDEKGLYELTTRNPEGKFDSWHVFEVLPASVIREHLEEDRIPLALIMPDGTWVSQEVYEYAGSPATPALDNWVEKIKKTLSEYPDALCALIDCHS